MKLLDALAAFHNWLCDRDFIWWPFSFLRPERSELMTLQKTVTMAASFGGLTFTIFTVYAAMNNSFTVFSAVLTLISSFVSFLVWFNLITKPLWNHRARRLGKVGK
jgi:hypothetical protein